MINLNNISLAFGGQKIFDDISISIPDGSRIGIVGKNGAGKTTLLKIISNKQFVDKGVVKISAKQKVRLLKQESVDLPQISILDYLKQNTKMADIEVEIKRLENELSQIIDHTSDKYKKILKQYEIIGNRYDAKGGYRFESEAMKILNGLGFEADDYKKVCTSFSGGWRIRISLSLILLENPDIMLLDEPTNHLDTESMEWLESYLKKYIGTIITVSHDRRFLDKTTTKTFEVISGGIKVYAGNYSYYEVEKEKNLILLKKQLETQIGQKKKLEDFIDRFRYKASKAVQVQSRIKMLDRIKEVEQAETSKSINIKFPEYSASGKDVLEIRNLAKSYDDKKVFSNLNISIKRGERIAVVGKNGAGKSTLLNLISEKIIPTAGILKYGVNVNKVLFSQNNTENLDLQNTVWEEIIKVSSKFEEKQRRNLLGAFLFSGDDIYKSISVLSGGEKSRLALLKVIMVESNLLILDEPTNHLDIKTKKLLNAALQSYKGTIIIVSHDRFFIDGLIDRVLEIKEHAFFDYIGNYSYFIKKKEELDKQEKLNEPVKESKKVIIDENVQKSNYKSKEQRREEATNRNKISKQKKVLENRIAGIEKEIADFENNIQNLHNDLCLEEVIANPKRIVEITKQLSDFEKNIANLYDEWEEKQEELEQLLKCS